MEVLVFDHGFQLAAISADLRHMTFVLVQSLGDLVLEFDHFFVVDASRLINQILVVSNLASDFVLHLHELDPFLSDVCHFFVDFLDFRDDFIMIFDSVLYIESHAFFELRYVEPQLVDLVLEPCLTVHLQVRLVDFVVERLNFMLALPEVPMKQLQLVVHVQEHVGD